MADAALLDAGTLFRDPVLAERFRRDGFVVVEAMPREQAIALRERAATILPDEASINDPQGALYGTLFDAERREAGERLACEALAPLLDRLIAGYRHEGGYLLAKLAGSGRLDMHQHQPLTRDIYETSVHFWLTLDDVGAGSGALRVVPGSHAITRHVQSFETAPYFAGFAASLEANHSRVLEMRAGEAVIFERSLLHGSEPNESGRTVLRLLSAAIPAASSLCILSEPEPGHFEALEVAGQEVDPTLYCIAGGNEAALRPAGTIANRNVALREAEFVALVESGEKVRPGFDPLDRLRAGSPSAGASEDRVGAAVLADAGLQADFTRDGYVAVPMLSPDEVADLLARLSVLQPGDNWAPDGSGPAMNSYHCSFLDENRAFKRAAFDLLAEVFAPVIARYLAGYRPLSANFYVKPPGRGRIPIHQNWPVLDDLSATSVTVWCPLVDVDARNGTLHLLKGSHKRIRHVEGPRSPAYFAAFESGLDPYLTPLAAHAGDGFIFDDGIVHGSPDNHAGQPRFAVQITCIPEAARPVFYYRADEENFELIEADSDFYIENSVLDLAGRGKDWVSRGLVPSENRALDMREFLALMGCEPLPEPAPPGWLRRLARRLRGMPRNVMAWQ